MTVETRLIDPLEAARLLPAFADLLVDAVAHGASVNFMQGFERGEAEAYWRRQIEGFAGGDRLWIVAEEDGAVVGMVMCLFCWQPNQPFRAEVSKMLVHSTKRRRGIGALLMRAVEAAALAAGRTLLVLDTAEGGAGDRLYRRMGWTPFGAVPGFAYGTAGAPETAVFFYKRLAETPAWRSAA
jgi:GNAT superfamily N-acetyltransferase